MIIRWTECQQQGAKRNRPRPQRRQSNTICSVAAAVLLYVAAKYGFIYMCHKTIILDYCFHCPPCFNVCAMLWHRVLHQTPSRTPQRCAWQHATHSERSRAELFSFIPVGSTVNQRGGKQIRVSAYRGNTRSNRLPCGVADCHVGPVRNVPVLWLG